MAPTCPLTPPAITEAAAAAGFNRINQLLLRNTAVANFLDRSFISLPCHAEGDAPVGLMLTGEHMGDCCLLALAQGVEAAIRA